MRKQLTTIHGKLFVYPLLAAVILAACARPAYPTAPTLPTAVPVSTPTATQGMSASPSPSPTVLSIAELVSLESTARALMATPEYAAAIPVWDQILAARPDYGEGYFQRGRAYLGLLDGETDLEPYLQNVERSRADLDRSIVHGPVTDGRNYYRRSQALMARAGVEPFRVDREVLMQAALENLEVSNAIGPLTSDTVRQEGVLLLELGRCQEARRVGERLVWELDAYCQEDACHDDLLAAAWSLLAGAAACDGEFEEAVDLLAMALELDPPASDHWTWVYERSLDLYLLGRPEEALLGITEDIEAFPYSSGERYFLRAVILLALGRVEEARADLEFGLGQTWAPIGLYYYARGSLAIQDGRVEDGIGELQLAEASMRRQHSALLEQVRQKLADLGASVLEVAAGPMTTTAVPTLTPSPTPRAAIPEGSTIPYRAQVIDTSVGTGPLMIRPHQDFVYAFRFQAPIPIQPDAVLDLTYRLIPYQGVAGEWSGLEVSILTPAWGAQPVSSNWGDNRVYDPGHYLRESGEVVMILDNPGELPLYLTDLGLRLVASAADGYLVVGPGAAPHLEALPAEGVDLSVDWPGSTGRLSLAPGETQTIHFSPAAPVEYARVEYVWFRAVNADPAGPPPDVVPWRPWSGGWGGTVRVQPDVFEALAPSAVVDADGDIVVRLVNNSGMPIELMDVSVEAGFLLEDGQALRLGELE